MVPFGADDEDADCIGEVVVKEALPFVPSASLEIEEVSCGYLIQLEQTNKYDRLLTSLSIETSA